MEVCLQTSTLTATTSACVLPAPQNISSKKIIMPSCSGPRMSNRCSSSNPSLSLSYRRRHGSKILCETSNVIDKVLVVNDSSWKNLVIESQSPVLVEFWAPWCGPCRMIAPVIDELAKEYAGKLVCFKVNTDDCPSIATEYGIRSIPTVLFFKNGEKKESVVGAVPKSTLCTKIEKYVEL